MSKEITTAELNSIIDRWGQCRRDHPDYMYKVSPTHYLTWTDIGGDIRHVYEKYGEWMIVGTELQDKYRDFDDFFWFDAQEHLVCIKDVILQRIEGEEEIVNKDGFANVLTSKVIKSIAYGATWPQMRIFIEKEVNRACGRYVDAKRCIRDSY